MEYLDLKKKSRVRVIFFSLVNSEREREREGERKRERERERVRASKRGRGSVPKSESVPALGWPPAAAISPTPGPLLGPAAQLTRDAGSQREEFRRLGSELVHNLSHCSPTLLHV